MATQSPPALNVARIVAAAFAQLEEEGLDGLTMRRLAAGLGVQAPAFYWHVGDKAELLGLMARDIYAPAYAGVVDASSWQDWLCQFGAALRRSLAAHRDGVRLCATARPPAHSHPAEQAARIAAPLVALGLGKEDALAFQASIISFVIGWGMFEANGPMRDFLEQMLNMDRSFAEGLRAMVRGFRPTAGPIA